MKTEDTEATVDARTRRLTEYAVEQVEARRREFGHLTPKEYVAMVEARRPQEDAELMRLIESGHFDTPPKAETT